MTQLFRMRCLVALLATATLLLPARAEEKQKPQAYAVLIGVAQYRDKQIKPRPHAEDDAKDLFDVLTDKQYLGVPKKNISLLLGKDDEKRGAKLATRENILAALQDVAKRAKANDTVYFAFFGEGGPLGTSGDRRGYFAVDSTFKGRDKDAVAADEVGEAFKNLQAKNLCAFLDVDFRGFTDGGPGLADVTLGNAPYKEFLGDDGSEDHTPISGRAIFLATNGLSTSLDLKDHGLFAAALLDGLRGAADKEGYEPDGVVTVDELSTYLDKRTHELSRENGKTREQKEQQYFAIYSPGTHFVVTTNPAAMAKATERLTKFDKVAKDSKLPENLVEEGHKLLERMPRLEAQRKLRKAYQELTDGKLTTDKLEESRAAILEETKLKRADAVEYARKVMEAVQLLRENYVKEENPGDLVTWAIRGIYRRIDEKVPAELEAQLKNAKTMDEDELKNLVVTARLTLGRREDLDKHKDIDIALQRMMSHLDPYTTYIDPEQLAKFGQEIDQEFTGIGIQIRKDSSTDMLLVVTPLKGSPAYKKGLQTGDLVTKITREMDSNGVPLDPPEVIETKGLAINDAVKKILGKAGTKVKLTVQREGVEAPIEYEITRGRVDVGTVLGIKRNPDDEWNYMIDPETKIGYVRLTSFARNTARDLQRVMNDLVKQKKIRGFVLDLRFNPGGLLDSAVKISDLFIDDGLIVSIRPRVGKETRFPGFHEGSLLDFPMVCMVNGGSASGSEIVSAALQDHKRAWIVGERSYGKGSVQNIQEFDGGRIKLTTASFWRPNGKNLNKRSTSGKDEDEWGVTPDKVVKLSAKEREDLFEAQRNSEIIQRKDKPQTTKDPKPEFKDRQLDEALEYLRDQIKMTAKVGRNGN